MSLSRIGKKIGNAALKAGLSSKMIDLKRRNIADAGLTASKGINMNRMTNYLDFKACKGNADDSSKMEKYSESMAVEKIAQAALKASQILNWNDDKRRMTSKNVEDAGFKPSKRKYSGFEHIEDMYPDFDDLYTTAYDEYIVDEFEVNGKDLWHLGFYAYIIFKSCPANGFLFAGHAIAIESIVDTATRTLNELYAIQNPGDELHGQGKVATNHTAPFKFRFVETKDDSLKQFEKDNSDTSDDEDREHYMEVGFMSSRNEMSIFMDSEECRTKLAEISRRPPSSSSKINWSRVIRFLEFKARKEYAMEIYGVKLGDFKSLKEKAYKLFEIEEAEAAMLASETMSMDFESLVVEKIADTAYKTSKLLNWVSYNNKIHESPVGFLADAGFKSPKSLMKYHRKKKAEACKAYTMETFGVDKVDINYLKNYALSCFAKRGLKEREAIIMACETIAVHRLFDDALKALNTTLHNNQLVELKEENTHGAMPGFERTLNPGHAN